MWILDLWCKGLGQELSVISSADGEVSGPLVKFFAACVNPLLPKPLTAGGIATIVDREKARGKRLQVWRDSQNPHPTFGAPGFFSPHPRSRKPA